MLVSATSAVMMLLLGAPGLASAAKPVRLAAIMPPARFNLVPLRRAVPVPRLARIATNAERLQIVQPARLDGRQSTIGLALGLGGGAVAGDRTDLRTLRLDQTRRPSGRGPLSAGFQLRLSGYGRDMQADVGVTGALPRIVARALAN